MRFGQGGIVGAGVGRAVAGAGAAVLLLSASTQVHAWGATGHRLIGRLGVKTLPADMPAFLHTEESIEAVGELAREPDRWKGAGKDIHDSTRNPAHFTTVDDNGKIAGGPPLNALPPNRAEFEKALQAVGTTSFKVGYLPYAIVDGWQQLTKDFAYWRVETAAIAIEKNPDHKAWMERDLKRRETLILADMGEWAHYVGDGSQPMHVSEHFNGWGKDYPNPNGYTVEPVHAYFEGAFVHRNLTEDMVQSAMPTPQTCTATIEVCTAQYLAATEASIVPFYTLQKAGGFVGSDPRGVAFANERIAAAAAEVRDLTVSAWMASSEVTVGYPAVSLAQVTSGAADAYSALYAQD